MSETAAPVQTSVASMSAGTRRATPSLMRMYALYVNAAPSPERDADTVDVRGARCAEDEHQPCRYETECEHAAAVEALAPERHCGNGDDRRERVQDERQQRCVEMLERDEIAPRLERVPARAEPQSDRQITWRDRAHL